MLLVEGVWYGAVCRSIWAVAGLAPGSIVSPSGTPQTTPPLTATCVCWIVAGFYLPSWRPPPPLRPLYR